MVPREHEKKLLNCVFESWKIQVILGSFIYSSVWKYIGKITGSKLQGTRTNEGMMTEKRPEIIIQFVITIQIYVTEIASLNYHSVTSL